MTRSFNGSTTATKRSHVAREYDDIPNKCWQGDEEYAPADFYAGLRHYPLVRRWWFLR